MENIQLSKNFSLRELISSPTALRKGIDNTPSKEIIERLRILCTDILQPIRDKWGKPIVITSGYRSQKLNRTIGGVKSSDHLFGNAADIRTLSDSLSENMKLFQMIKEMIDKKEIEVKQLIFEKGNRDIGPDWIHISYQDGRTLKKNQILYL